MTEILAATLTGERTTIDQTALDEFRAEVRGIALTAQDDGYDAARAIWNGMIDKRPALIVRCSGPADVMDAVRFARERNLLVSVRGGGHNVTGNSMVDDGLVIDLSPMAGVRVDPIGRTVRAQGGATLGALDRETQAFGLAVPSGIVTTTGIGGLTLGGGFGHISRRYGLTCDNLLSVDMVTADGEYLTASEEENEDLFWAVRGGGGNFGIVTSFNYQLQSVGPTVIGGMLLHPLDRAREFYAHYKDFIAEAPGELSAMPLMRLAPPAPFIPEDVHGTPIAGVLTLHSGSLEEGERALAPLREFGEPLVDGIGPKPFRELQAILDASAPHGWHYYLKSEFLPRLSDDALDVMVDHASRITSPQATIAAFHLGGAISAVDEDATAYSHRNAAYSLIINCAWVEAKDTDRNIAWTREFWQAMQPHSSGGAYVNFQSQDEGVDRVQTAYGSAKYERLVELKNRFDPSNFFRLNQNIQPNA
jgi:FAD/FMN-containing dehydrogenase